jgi:tRNA threonylcarbamoyl adenosine modification protein YeaZ
LANSKALYGLAIDTSSAVLTLAIGSLDGSCRECSWHLDREISARLHPLLQDFIVPQQWTDLAWLSVLKGPGSFTGTRIGVVTARILAQQLNVPLYGVSNLAIAAWMEAHQQNQGDHWTVAVSQPGRLGFLYGAIYEVRRQAGTLKVLRDDSLMTIEDWNKILYEAPPLQFHLKLNDEGPENASSPKCSLGKALLSLGWQSWQRGLRPDWIETLPYYG